MKISNIEGTGIMLGTLLGSVFGMIAYVLTGSILATLIVTAIVAYFVPRHSEPIISRILKRRANKENRRKI